MRFTARRLAAYGMSPPLLASNLTIYADQMSISDDRARDFIRVYKEEVGDELSADEAREMLTRLGTLYQLLARPVPGEPHHQQDVGDFGEIGDVV